MADVTIRYDYFKHDFVVVRTEQTAHGAFYRTLGRFPTREAAEAAIPSPLAGASLAYLLELLRAEDPNSCFDEMEGLTADGVRAYIASDAALLAWVVERLSAPCDECGELPADCCCVAFTRDPIDPSDV